jgi:hypothetical protein
VDEGNRASNDSPFAAPALIFSFRPAYRVYFLMIYIDDCILVFISESSIYSCSLQ